MRLTRDIRVADAHEDAAWCCTWVPGSGDLITGSVDESVKVWRPPPPGTGGGSGALEPLHTYVGHTLGALCVAADSEGSYAASSSLDSFVRVWSLKDTSTKAVIETPPGETWQIAFAPPGASPGGDPLVASAGGASNKVVLWSTDDAEKVAELLLPGGEGDDRRKDAFVLSVAYSPDGRRLACGSVDGGVAVFDVASGALLHSLVGHFKPVRSLAFTPDSKTLVTACDDMHCHVYDVENAALVEALSGHESWVLSVAVHPGGTHVASSSSDSTVKLWDLNTRTCVQTAREHADQVWGVAWAADGARLASVSDDKSLVVYSAA